MAAGATYEPIANTTLTGNQSTIDFTSISGSYTDLKLVLSTLTDVAGKKVYLRYNSDTGSNYSFTLLDGQGTTASSLRLSSQTFFNTMYSTPNGTSTTIPCLHILDIFSYAGSTNKTALLTIANDANGSGNVQRQVLLWAQTSAITSINLYLNSGNYASGTTATLYGIKAA